MDVIYLISAMLILSFFGALGALDFARLIRSREVKIWNLKGWPYEHGPYRRSEAPVRFYIAIAVNSFFVLFGLGGIIMLILIYSLWTISAAFSAGRSASRVLKTGHQSGHGSGLKNASTYNKAMI